MGGKVINHIIADSFTARPNNSKENLFNLSKKNKINNLKTNIIMNNIVKIKKNDDPDFLNNKGDFRYKNKRGGRLYNKNNNNENKKIRVIKLDKYHKEREKLKFKFF